MVSIGFGQRVASAQPSGRYGNPSREPRTQAKAPPAMLSPAFLGSVRQAPTTPREKSVPGATATAFAETPIKVPVSLSFHSSAAVGRLRVRNLVGGNARAQTRVRCPRVSRDCAGRTKRKRCLGYAAMLSPGGVSAGSTECGRDLLGEIGSVQSLCDRLCVVWLVRGNTTHEATHKVRRHYRRTKETLERKGLG